VLWVGGLLLLLFSARSPLRGEDAQAPLGQGLAHLEHARFQEAIDRAAMRAGKGSSDAYLAEWRRSEPSPCDDDIERAAAAEASRLEARYTDDDLERLIQAKGVAGTPAPQSAD